MMADGSWAVGQLKNTFPKMVGKTAVAPFPSIDGDPTRTTATLGGWTLTGINTMLSGQTINLRYQPSPVTANVAPRASPS